MLLSIIRSCINSTSDTPSSKDAESIEVRERGGGWMGVSSHVAPGKGTSYVTGQKAAGWSPKSVQMSRRRENDLASGENPIK
jgi:hypothetical protein